DHRNPRILVQHQGLRRRHRCGELGVVATQVLERLMRLVFRNEQDEPRLAHEDGVLDPDGAQDESAMLAGSLIARTIHFAQALVVRDGVHWMVRATMRNEGQDASVASHDLPCDGALAAGTFWVRGSIYQETFIG